MANALVKLFKGDDVETLRATIAGLEEKRRAEALRIDNAERERGRLALAVEAGDKAAVAELEKLNVRIPAAKTRLANIEAAIAEAQERLAEAENTAARDQMRDRIARLDQRRDDRLGHIAKTDKLMRELTAELDQADQCVADIEALTLEIGKAGSRDRRVEVEHGEFRKFARAARLVEFAVTIGLGKHFRLDEKTSPSAHPDKSLVAIEREAQRGYVVTEAEAWQEPPASPDRSRYAEGKPYPGTSTLGRHVPGSAGNPTSR